MTGMVVLGWRPCEVWACATCFGAPESPMTQGLNMGIFSLLAVVLMVLGGAAAFFIFLARRAGRPMELEPRTAPGSSHPPGGWRAESGRTE